MTSLGRLLLALIAVLALGAEASAKQLNTFTEGKYSGGAYANDTTGQFTNCIGAAPFAIGGQVMTMGVAVFTDYRWLLLVGRQDWTLSTGAKFPYRLRIDDGAWISGQADAAGAQALMMMMPSDDKTLESFRSGNLLEWTDGKQTFQFPLDGTSRLMARLYDCVKSQTGVAAAPSTGQPANVAKAGTGTGMIVTTSGHVVTNQHVVKECKTITVQRPGEAVLPATLVVADQRNDLALIKVNTVFGEDEVGRLSAGRSVAQGETIAVYGFPLSGLLSAAGNIVTGNVSALAGLSNDINQMQISAPAQPGNSGGPVLNSKGAIVGVVQSGLATMEISGLVGAVPQNVNFAIKTFVLVNFLDANSIVYRTAEAGPDLDLVALATLAKRFTVQVRCNL